MPHTGMHRAGLAASRAIGATMMAGYVPDGLTKEQWARIQKEEAKKQKGLGGVGVDKTRFKSRSMASFMQDMEEGKAKHLFPVSPAKVKTGEIPLSQVPYMQRRGGSWDDADVAGMKRKQWNARDKDYA
mmetsp:Transcript_30491/g.75147  ORF Transcript_30491/g.75147 Transcript_30491/m.75147 type:complete len:129 (-) Transcript_30491:53-439(-)